jgi:NADH:ubiquinone oxidoreductase subunit 4 (subunit M)
MIDAWFSPDVSRGFAFLSLFSLLALVAPLVQRGLYKTLVVGTYAAVAAMGLVLLGLAAVASSGGQPGYVIRSFVVSGVVLAVIFTSMLPMIVSGYRDAERRKIAAKDL